MAATLQWYISDNSVEDFVSLPSIYSNVIRFKNANNNVNDLNDPMIRPSSLTNYSFEKALQVFITVTGGATSLSSLRVRISTNDIQLSAGGSANVAQAYNFESSYTQPQQYSGGGGGVGGAMPNREGVLSTSNTTWTNATTVTSFSPPFKWDNSDSLYVQLEVGTGSGGTLATWQTIAVYNEV